MSNIALPNMTVEARNSNTAHAVPAPNLSNNFMREQFAETIQLNSDAREKGWKKTTTDLLIKHIPVQVNEDEIVRACNEVIGFKNWREVSIFVRDDMCLDFFNKALYYCLNSNQPHVQQKDFIDGSGVGYVEVYRDRLKVTLEQAFDAKYYYKVRRPLVWAIQELGLDLSACANHIHPGHWSYCAGHGTKFLTAVETLSEVFAMDEDCYRMVFIAACVASHGRSGNLIHYPMDNLAGGYLTRLQEFN